MVSTRQSSNVSSSVDPCVSGACQPVTDPPHQVSHYPIGKILRSTIVTAASEGASTSQPQPSHINILDLPPEVLEKIFTYLGYKNVAQLRMVCHQLDKVCGSMLNSTFQRLQNQMLHRFQGIKSKMPRRESARRNHPLACESDIIETLHMRLTLLQMTFGKHIERKHCCFFAGEILDEVHRILYYIKVTPKLARPYKVTDELFDLSTMAMEFFKEHIEPTLPEIAYFGNDFMDFTFSGSSPSSKYFTMDSPPHGKGYESPTSGNDTASIDPQPLPQSNMVLRKRIRKIKQGMKRYNSQLTVMRRDLRGCKSKISEQQKQIVEYTARMDEYDKKNEETSRKFSTLLQELNKCKTELQYWRSKTPVMPPVCNNCGHTGLVPTPTEEQAVYNNVLYSNVDGNLPLEAIEFPSEATTSNEDDLWMLYEPKKEEKYPQVPQTQTNTFDQMESPKNNKLIKEEKLLSPMKYTPLTSKPGCSGKNYKRKMPSSEEDEVANKLPKRVLKVRSASKRVKT